MPGSLVTRERREPVRRLKRVDLPTLGRPIITSDGILLAIRVNCQGTGVSTVTHSAATCEEAREETVTRGHPTPPVYFVRADSKGDASALCVRADSKELSAL